MKKSFKGPNRNAPRFRETSMHVLNMGLYKKFKEKFPEYDLTFEQFKTIVNTYNIKLGEGIIEYRDGVELPESLGYIFIGSCAAVTSKPNIDFNKSIQYGVMTTHKNWDSDNRLMKIFFTNYLVKYKMKNKSLWMFAPNREFKRKASKCYVEDYNKYIVVDPKRKISYLFQENLERMRKAIKANRKASEDYNEFDL